VKIEAILRANGHTPLLQEYEFYIKELAKVEHLSFTTDRAPEKAAIGIYKDVEIFVPIKDLIDVPKELARIEKELSKINGELERLFNKLNNTSFLEKAPSEVIEKNERNYKMFQEKREKLTASRKVLKTLSGD
jgi:valyl-tRNA synthetase